MQGLLIVGAMSIVFIILLVSSLRVTRKNDIRGIIKCDGTRHVEVGQEKWPARVIDWRVELKQADVDWIRLLPLAMSWHTNPVGQQWNGLQRYDDASPKDVRLGKLGREFKTAMAAMQRRKALSLVTKIEARTANIMENMEATPSIRGSIITC